MCVSIACLEFAIPRFCIYPFLVPLIVFDVFSFLLFTLCFPSLFSLQDEPFRLVDRAVMRMWAARSDLDLLGNTFDGKPRNGFQKWFLLRLEKDCPTLS